MSLPHPTSTSPKPITVAIIGSGIGGLVLAIGLQNQLQNRKDPTPIQIQIYEAAPAFHEIGAGMVFGPNAVEALGLVSADLLAAFQKLATSNRDENSAWTWLSVRWGMEPQNRCSANDNGEEATKEEEAGPKIGTVAFEITRDKYMGTGTTSRGCVHRARFLDEMVKLIPSNTTIFNKSLVGLEELPSSSAANEDEHQGGVRMFFADGTTATADAIIGCDGIKSRTRTFLYGDSGVQPKYTNTYAYRALVPAAEFVEVMGEERAFNGQIYSGYGGYMVTYPVDFGESINVVAPRSKGPAAKWEHEAWQVPANEAEIREELEGWHPGLVELLAKHSRAKWALFDLKHEAESVKGRVALLGDSFHASSPHLGAGAGQAVEDAYILSHLLGDIGCAEDINNAFEAYDQVRRPRSQQLVALSKQSGLGFALMEDAVGDDMAELWRRTDARCDWIWNVNFEEELARAKRIMTGLKNSAVRNV